MCGSANEGVYVLLGNFEVYVDAMQGCAVDCLEHGLCHLEINRTFGGLLLSLAAHLDPGALVWGVLILEGREENYVLEPGEAGLLG